MSSLTGERVARKSTNGVFYYFSDHLKTASVITDAAGVIKSESDYYPWGGELQVVNNDSNHYKFTGKERDAEPQLDYFGARYYSNGLGRWVSADWSATPVPVPYASFGDPQTLNLYGFVGGNPASKADPDGHLPDLEGLIITWTVDTYGPRVWPAIKSLGSDIGNAVSDFFDEAGRGFHAAYSNCPCSSQPAPSWSEEDSKNNNNSQSSNTAEQGRDAQGKFTSKQPGQSSPGATAEREALEAVGATKNTEAIPGSNRIPDGTITNAAGKVEQYVEGKSGAVVSNTAQLRQMAKAAMNATGKPLKLVTTNPNVKIAKTVSGNENIEIVQLNQK
jgi:RHS repeat-associated protein